MSDSRPATKPEGIADGVGEELSVPEAAATLVGAVERAGHPWRFLPAREVPGLDLDPAETSTWQLCLPDGRLLGLVVRDHGGSDRHDELIRVLIRTVRTLIVAEQTAADAERRASEAEQEARTDPLTGLPNRRAWKDALRSETARMARHGGSAVAVVIDLDGLKELNDTDGHLAGDLLIRRAANAIRTAVRDSDVIARLGGDEFGVLAVETDSPGAVVQRLREAMAHVEVEASIGAGVAQGPDALPGAVADADDAMYRDKRRRRRRHHLRSAG